MSLYPKARTSSNPEAMDANEVAKRIIEGMETGKITFSFTTAKYGKIYELPKLDNKKPELVKPHFVGPCLRLPDDPDDVENPGRGSDDVDTFNRVWDEIHKEASNLRLVNPALYTSKTNYVAALQEKASHLESQKWADGTIAEAGVTTFAALRMKLVQESL